MTARADARRLPGRLRRPAPAGFRRALGFALVLAFFVLASPAWAQSGPEWLRGRAVEADVGVAWIGGASLGRAPATLTPNQTQGSPYELFETETRLAAAPALEARVGYRITRAFALEGTFLYSTPELQTRITRDQEDAESITATERLSEYRIEGSAVWHIVALGGSRAVPFVFGGAGYLRQLHQDRALLETARTFHAGAGVKVALSTRPRGLVKTLGIRADARIYVRDGGISVSDEPQVHTGPAASAGLMVGF